MDVVSAAPGLHSYNSASCDDGTVLGSGGQTVYDPAIVTGSTNPHYLYVAQNDHLSPGIVRFSFDPSGDKGAPVPWCPARRCLRTRLGHYVVLLLAKEFG
jgi:hypothetical protein